MKSILRSVCVTILALVSANCFAQTPNISYSGPQVYKAGTTITPISPVNTGGAVPAQSTVTLGTFTGGIGGIALDAAGNIFVSDRTDSTVKKISGNGGLITTVTPKFNGTLYGLAVDAVGDIYISDGDNKIDEVRASDGTVIELPYSFDGPFNIAINAAGVVYISNFRAGNVIMYTPGTGTFNIVGTNFKLPTGIAIGALSEVYVAQETANTITTLNNTIIARTNQGVVSIATDAAGNIYCGNPSDTTGSIMKIPAHGGTPTVLASGMLTQPHLHIDAAGNIYTDLFGYQNLTKIINGIYAYSINKPLPAGLTFDNNTGIISGTPAAASSSTDYVITANNAAGSSSTTINITVNPLSAPAISYSSPRLYEVGATISPLLPVNTGGTPGAESIVVFATGFNAPQGLAADAQGNIYVADFSGSIKKVLASGGSPIIVATGFNYPKDVAVDAAGNLYVADWQNSLVKKIPAGGGPAVSIGSGFSYPRGIAVDAAGNVYVVDDGGHNAIKEIPIDGGPVIRIGMHFREPSDVAVDAAGNFYTIDYYTLIKKTTPGGISKTLSSSFYSSQLTLDPAGNIYATAPSENTLMKIPAGGGSPVPIGYGLWFQGGVTLDHAGNIYVSNEKQNNVKKIITVAHNYTISPALPAGLVLDSNTGEISGTPTVASPATNYLVTAYNAAGSSSADVSITVNLPGPPIISYNSPNVYHQGTAIVPLAPENTGGAASIQTQVKIASLGYQAVGVAVDALGNVYLAGFLNSKIEKIPADGSPKVTVASGFTGPAGIAVDAAGNLYVADTFGDAVKEIPAGGGPIVTLGSGFAHPWGIAVDAAGNVYVADSNNNAVKKIPAGGGAPVTIASGLHPVFLAADAAGNVYVSDFNNKVLKKIPAGGGSIVTLATVAGGPNGVAVDRAGNVYVADLQNQTITKVPAGGGSPIIIASAIPQSVGLAVNTAGDLYIAGKGFVDEIIFGGYTSSPSLPAGLSIDRGTGVISGTPTANSPATDYIISAKNRFGTASAVVNISVDDPLGLEALSVSAGTLSPEFSANVTTYDISVPNVITAISFTPTTNASMDTVRINGQLVASGTASSPIPLSVGANSVVINVTAPGSQIKTYTVTVTRTGKPNYGLAGLAISDGAFSPSFDGNRPVFNIYENNEVSSVSLTPTTILSNSTVIINGVSVASGSPSVALPLVIGQNTVSVIVKNHLGDTTFIYTLNITRSPSANARIAHLSLSEGNLSPRFSPDTFTYVATVKTRTSAISVTPTVREANASVTVNGITVLSGTPSANIPLAFGDNTITLTTLAQNGTIMFTYTVVVTRPPSDNPNLTAIYISPHVGLTRVPGEETTNYIAAVSNSVSSVAITPVTADAGATVRVNGSHVLSGHASAPIPVNVGENSITAVATAQDGIVTKTYVITVTRAPASLNSVYQPVGVAKTPETARLGDEITVHEGVSPNGDGLNDVFTIDNIKTYPQNSLKIMSRSGTVIFEAKGYDNSTKIFDGHSSKNGKMQQPGTYFYSLDYLVKGVTRHKTGYIVLKY